MTECSPRTALKPYFRSKFHIFVGDNTTADTDITKLSKRSHTFLVYYVFVWFRSTILSIFINQSSELQAIVSWLQLFHLKKKKNGVWNLLFISRILEDREVTQTQQASKIMQKQSQKVIFYLFLQYKQNQMHCLKDKVQVQFPFCFRILSNPVINTMSWLLD